MKRILSIYDNWVLGTEMDPDSKVHGNNMGPIWGRQDPGGPHVGPMNFAIWRNVVTMTVLSSLWTVRGAVVLTTFCV